MIPLSKIHEGCSVLLTNLTSEIHIDKTSVQFFIEHVDGEANKFQFRYYWPSYSDKTIFPTMTNEYDFSQSLHWGNINGAQVFEVKQRYNKPLSFWREIKFAAIRIVHLILERTEFNMKN